MGAVTIREMREAESAAMANGWTEDSLLHLAGSRLGRAIGRFFPQPRTAIGYLGKGHNAGDALVALGSLRDEFGWEIAIRRAFPESQFARLSHRKWLELGVPDLPDRPQAPDFRHPLILLDGLLGIGSKGAPGEPISTLVQEMDWLRNHAGAKVAAVDIPTGVDADTGIASACSVRADITFMIGNAKQGLLSSQAACYTGALAVIPIEALEVQGTAPVQLISPQTEHFGKTPRSFDFHKGMAGRVAIYAGSEAYAGAAALAAIGALRGGAGLVTLHVPHGSITRISALCPPEVMVRPVNFPGEISADSYDAIVTGCGLGELDAAAAEDLFRWIEASSVPMVIDADALNAISRHQRTDLFKDHHVLTPHPGEFRRLAPDLSDRPREEAATRFASRHSGVLLLKGARTLITKAGNPLLVNSTGTPGMASGGQGDLLAGVIGAILASGSEPIHAAAWAAWLCGRASEIAMSEAQSELSLSASDVSLGLGAALNDWRTGQR